MFLYARTINRRVEKGQPKKKKILGRLKEASEDKEEQLAILSTFVKLVILVWSASILTLAYVRSS